MRSSSKLKRYLSNIYKNSILIIALRGLSVPIRYVLNWLGAFLYGPVVMGAFSTTRSFLDILLVFAGLGGDKVMLRFLTHAHADDKLVVNKVVNNKRFVVENQKKVSQAQENVFQNKKDVSQNKKIGSNFVQIFSALFVLYFVISLLVGISIFLLSGVIAGIYQKPWLQGFFKISAVTLPFLVMVVYVNQAFKAINKPFWATLFETSAYNLLVLLFVWIFAFSLPSDAYKVYGFHLGFLVGTLLTLIIAYITLSKSVRKLMQHRVLDIYQGISYWMGKKGSKHIKLFLQIAVPILIISSLYLYIMNIDRILLPKFVNGVNLGIYYIAGRVAGLIQIIGIGLLAVTPVHIVQNYKKFGQNSAIKYIVKISFLSFLLSVLVAGITIPLIPFLLKLFGKKYVVASSYTIFLLVANIIFNIGIIAGQGVILLNKQRELLKWLLIFAVLITFAGLYLLQAYNIVGATLLYMLAQVSIAISNWLALLQGISVKRVYKTVQSAQRVK